MRSLLLLSVLSSAVAFRPAIDVGGSNCLQVQSKIQNYRHFASTASSFEPAIAEADGEQPALSLDTSVPDKWEAICDAVFEDDERPIILFDGECGLCTDSVNFAIDHDPEANFRFVSIHSTTARALLLKAGRNPLDISSIIVCYPSGKAKSNSDAVIAIADQLQGVLPMLASSGRILPSPIRDTIYGFISKHRKKIYIGEYDSCRLDFDGEFESRFVTEPDV